MKRKVGKKPTKNHEPNGQDTENVIKEAKARAYDLLLQKEQIEKQLSQFVRFINTKENELRQINSTQLKGG